LNQLPNQPLPVLYISYDGMTDPLGQSQVLPYLIHLKKSHPQITILSAEKPERYAEGKENIAAIMNRHGITWIPLVYHKQPPLFSTYYDSWKLKKKATTICSATPHIVHCRSYIAGLIGLHLKHKFNVNFIFDMRGFWADERIEGGIWPKNHWLFSKVYRYFKRKEQAFFKHADTVISLTHQGKHVLNKTFGVDQSKISVVPCCVDTHTFLPEKIDVAIVASLKKQLGIQQNDFVVGYLGSIGTWYLLEEMMQFFAQLKQRKNNARFLFITTESAATIYLEAQKAGLNSNDIIITKSERGDVPLHLSLCHLGLFFIKPVFSKIASSPTKMGEMLSMGLPVICNTGVGDVEQIVNEGGCGLAIDSFTPEAYKKAIDEIDVLLKTNPEQIRAAADRYFNLEEGVEQYRLAYTKKSYS
jgi:glycosyltransferase involved in cell wall biosynthesis